MTLDREGREAGADRDGADVVELDRRDPRQDRVRRGERHPLVVIHEQQRELVAAEPECLAALAEPRGDL